MTKKQDYEAVDKLLKSEGWAVLQREMEKSILQAAYFLAEQKDITNDQMHFRRGAMWAARKFLELPEAVKSILNNDILLDAAHKGEIKPERYGPQQ